MLQGCKPDRTRVGKRLAAFRHIHHQGDRTALYQIDDIHPLVLDGKLYVDQTNDRKRARHSDCFSFDFLDCLSIKRMRRQYAGTVPGMHPCFLDVLHNAADNHLLTIANRIDIDLSRADDELVDQHGLLLIAGAEGFLQCSGKFAFLTNAFHRSAPKHEGGPDHYRKPHV